MSNSCHLSDTRKEEKMHRKETVFEGYYSACWECSYLVKAPEYSNKGKVWNHKRRWFREYLKRILEEKPEAEPCTISLDDLIPRKVFEELLQNPNTKFRFKVVVEAKEILGARFVR